MREAEFIDITLDRPRKMALPLGALRRAEREFNRQRALDGKPETSIFRIAGDQMTLLAVDGSISIDLVVVMLWASLLHEDKDLTIEAVEASMPYGMYCTTKVFECLAIWMRTPVGAIHESPATEAGGDAAAPLAQLNGSTSGPAAE